MEISEKLYVSAEAFFDQLAQSVAYDISNTTGKKVRAKQVCKGYSYSKKLKNKMGRKGDVKVTITDFEAPRIYAVEFESSQGTNFMSYQVENLGDCIGVTYTEDFTGKTTSKNMNYKIMSFLYNRGSKKKARRLLRAMEKYIMDESYKNAEEASAIEENSEA